MGRSVDKRENFENVCQIRGEYIPEVFSNMVLQEENGLLQFFAVNFKNDVCHQRYIRRFFEYQEDIHYLNPYVKQLRTTTSRFND